MGFFDFLRRKPLAKAVVSTQSSAPPIEDPTALRDALFRAANSGDRALLINMCKQYELAVLEHFPAEAYQPLGEGCARFLKPGGHLVITVPSPAVDQILEVLKTLRLIDGMSLEEHHGFQIRQTLEIFPSPRFELVRNSRFQLGLNNLFVFRRTATASRN